MKNPIYDGGRSPVNRHTGIVLSKGVHFEQKVDLRDAPDQKEPLPTRPDVEIPLTIRHLIGYRYGRLTVIGYSIKPEKWVVRCACGVYTLRRTAAIRNPENRNDCCQYCYEFRELQRKVMETKLGRPVLVDEMPGACLTKPPLPSPIKQGPYKVHRPPPKPRQGIPLHHTELERLNKAILRDKETQVVAAARSHEPSIVKDGRHAFYQRYMKTARRELVKPHTTSDTEEKL